MRRAVAVRPGDARPDLHRERLRGESVVRDRDGRRFAGDGRGRSRARRAARVVREREPEHGDYDSGPGRNDKRFDVHTRYAVRGADWITAAAREASPTVISRAPSAVGPWRCRAAAAVAAQSRRFLGAERGAQLPQSTRECLRHMLVKHDRRGVGGRRQPPDGRHASIATGYRQPAALRFRRGARAVRVASFL